MKKKFLFLLLPILVISCQQELPDTGHLVFHAYLESYTKYGGLTLQVDLDSQTRSLHQSKTATFNDENYAYSMFTDMDAGVWEATVQFIDGDTLLGETEPIEIEAIPQNTISTTITGRYSDGSITFTITTESSEVQSTVELDKQETVIVAKMMKSDSEPTVGANIFGWGNFGDVATVSVKYPDGYEVTYGSKNGDRRVYAEIRDDATFSERYDYYESGLYTLKITDTNGAVSTYTDELQVEAEENYLPMITSHSTGQILCEFGDEPIMWDTSLSEEVKSVAVLLVPKADTSQLLWYDVIEDPDTTFQSSAVPSSLVDQVSDGNYYYITVMAFDVMVSEELISSLNNFEYHGLSHELARESEKNLSAITYQMCLVE